MIVQGEDGFFHYRFWNMQGKDTKYPAESARAGQLHVMLHAGPRSTHLVAQYPLEALIDWSEIRKAERKHAIGTIREQTAELRRLLKGLFEVKIGDVTKVMLVGVIEACRVERLPAKQRRTGRRYRENTTLDGYANLIRGLFRLARDAGFIKRSPANGLTARLKSGVPHKLPQAVGARPRASVIYPSGQQLSAMHAVTQIWHRVGLCLVSTQGLKPSEANGVARSGFDPFKRKLTIEHTVYRGVITSAPVREVVLDDEAMALLLRLEVVRRRSAQLPERDGRLLPFVFANQAIGVIARLAYQLNPKAMSARAEGSGPSRTRSWFSSEDLRNHAVVRWIEQGRNERQVARKLGLTHVSDIYKRFRKFFDRRPSPTMRDVSARIRSLLGV